MPQSVVARPHQDSSVPDMPGIKAEGDLARTLRIEVAQLLGRQQLGFPGAQPVSFCRSHIEKLKQQDYYLCEKSDGIRCLMYFTSDGDREIHYLIDRKNEYYYVPNLHFPLPNDENFQKFHVATLIDGELVLDKVPGTSRRVLKYLVFDCLIIDGRNVMERTLDKRLAYVREFVYTPYQILCKKFPQEVDYFPFILEFKHMEFSYAMEKVFREILPNLKHGSDGLIFTCRTSPYKHGTDPNILKWKPASENSVDFRLTLKFPLVPVERTPSPSPTSSSSSPPSSPSSSSSNVSLVPDYHALPVFKLSVYMGNDTQPDGSNYKEWGEMYVTDAEWEDFKALGQPLEEAIVECSLDAQKRWKFMRFRTDKTDGNHITTVRSVMDSIRDGVEKDELVRSWKEIREAWKRRNAPNGHA